MNEKLTPDLTSSRQKTVHRTYRYPGVTPFTSWQANVFFGRQQDTSELYRLIGRESLVVLYGKSGFGKSSLLNAGIVPLCRKMGVYHPVVIRFGAWTEGTPTSPLAITKAALGQGVKAPGFLENLLPGDTSLWFYAKKRQLHDWGRPLLLFDQFEELFSYPEAQVKAFQEELSELLHTGIPLRFRRMADNSGTITEEEEDQLEANLDARIVFAIRSDRMHLLDRLQVYLPNVMRHCKELKALTLEDARDAILLPARLENDHKTIKPAADTREIDPEIEFITPAFDYTPAAVDKLLNYLQDEIDNEKRVEGILLQMLCEHYERRLVEAKGLTLLDLPQTGDPKLVVKKYYEEKIENLPEAQRLPARILIEDGLVSEGEAMRLSLHESFILREFGVDKTMLEKLVDSRLLRSEPFLRGGYSYELSHDRLVAPVLYSRRKRREEEARLEMLRREEERQQKLREAQKIALQERKKKRRAQMWALGAVLLALTTLVASVYSYNAMQQKQEAQERVSAVLEDIDKAHREQQLAEENLKNKLLEVAQAQQELNLLKVEQSASEKEREQAEKRFEQLQRQTEVALATLAKATEKLVNNQINEARNLMFQIQFDTAFERLKTTAKIGFQNRDVAYALQEVGFFYCESGQYAKAAKAVQLAAGITGNQTMQRLLAASESGSLNRPDLQKALKSIQPDSFDVIYRRYYPVITRIPGGEFTMGCDTCEHYRHSITGNSMASPHAVEIDDFEIGKTEVTVWNYALYCAATGKDLIKKSPAWGLEGDNPMVNVDWYDAVEYCNWLSAMMGIEPAYQIDYTVRDMTNFKPDTNKCWSVTPIDGANGFRLPTEAEWEYAAREGPKNNRANFSGSDTLEYVGWYLGNCDSIGAKRTRAVITRRPNQLGLYDLTGNAYEWCWDWIKIPYPADKVKNPAGAPKGASRVRRGGSYLNGKVSQPVWFRASDIPTFINYTIGFRVAKSP